MGIMMTKDMDEKSELNRRISSDLRARTTNANLYDDDDDADEVVDAREGKKTSRFAWVWIVLIILAIISLVCIVFI